MVVIKNNFFGQKKKIQLWVGKILGLGGADY
jgi:hypothetical protein